MFCGCSAGEHISYDILWYQMKFGWWCQMLVTFGPFPKATRSHGPRTSQACWWRPTLNLLGAAAKCNRKHFRCRSRNFTRRRVSENSIFLVFLVFLSTNFTYLYSSLRTRQPIEPISSHSCHSWHPELYPCWKERAKAKDSWYDSRGIQKAGEVEVAESLGCWKEKTWKSSCD